MTGTGLRWTVPPSTIAAKIDQIQNNIGAVVLHIVQPAANDISGRLKREAPWTDRSSNARTGLTVKAFFDGKTIRVVAFHTVFYGIFLETKNGGAYAIILKVTNDEFPKLLQDIRDAFIGVL